MDSKHKIESVEAQWLRIPLVFTDDGLEYQECKLSDIQEGMVQGTEDMWEYECSCGRSFETMEEARIHLMNTDLFEGVKPPVNQDNFLSTEKNNGDFTPSTVEDGYVFTIVNKFNDEKRSYCEDEEVAEKTIELLGGEIFELRIIDLE